MNWKPPFRRDLGRAPVYAPPCDKLGYLDLAENEVPSLCACLSGVPAAITGGSTPGDGGTRDG